MESCFHCFPNGCPTDVFNDLQCCISPPPVSVYARSFLWRSVVNPTWQINAPILRIQACRSNVQSIIDIHNMELFDKICVQRDDKILFPCNVTGYFHLILYRTLTYQPIQVSDFQLTSSKLLSQHKKYGKAFGIAQKLASLTSEIPMNVYHNALECLHEKKGSM